MKKVFILSIFSLFTSSILLGQTSTENFEQYPNQSTSFTNNNVKFNIISHTGNFSIKTYPNTGWNGFEKDNGYIDNTIDIGSPNASFSIKTTSNLFKVNRFWVFVGNQMLNQAVVGKLTVTGKLSGITKFTQTKTTGFTTSIGATNGYTLIDLTNLNGQNYSNIIIDELRLTLDGDYYYVGFDSFTWVKDQNMVLSATDVKASQLVNIYPNPTIGPLTITTNEASIAEVYNQEGKLVKSTNISNANKKFDISELPKGIYYIKVGGESTKVIKQ